MILVVKGARYALLSRACSPQSEGFSYRQIRDWFISNRYEPDAEGRR